MQLTYFLALFSYTLAVNAVSPEIGDMSLMTTPKAVLQLDPSHTPSPKIPRLQRCERPGELTNAKIREVVLKTGSLRVVIDQPLAAVLGGDFSDPTDFYNWNFEGVDTLFLRATTTKAAKVILDNLRFLDALSSVTLLVDKPVTPRQVRSFTMNVWPDDKHLHLVFVSKTPQTETHQSHPTTLIDGSSLKGDIERDKYISQEWERILESGL